MSASVGRRLVRRRAAAAVSPLTADDLEGLLSEAFAIYTAAMRYPSTYAASRIALARDQIRLPGFTAVGAFRRGRLIGFGYGYDTEPGQWWYDEVARGLRSHPEGDEWLHDAFELCELHMAPGHQGHGMGRAMLRSVLRRATRPSVLLSTPRPARRRTPAIGLYESTGFAHLLPDYRFSGDPRPFTIMGRRRGADDHL